MFLCACYILKTAHSVSNTPSIVKELPYQFGQEECPYLLVCLWKPTGHMCIIWRGYPKGCGTQWHSGLRNFATSRKVTGSIPHGAIGIFNSFRPHCGPGVDSTSNRNGFQDSLLGGKGGRCVGPTILPLHVPIVFVEPPVALASLESTFWFQWQPFIHEYILKYVYACQGSVTLPHSPYIFSNSVGSRVLQGIYDTRI